MLARLIRAEALVANPLRLLALAFLALIGLGTLLLWLPVSVAADSGPNLIEALFTATSAVCVTGLTVVDTATHWTYFGQVVILGLIQLGGLGIVTLATLAFLAVSDRMGLVHMRALAAEVGTTTFAGVGRLVRIVVITTLACEAVLALVLTLRFWISYDYSPDIAIAHGVFHSVSAWNNAGFALYSDSMMRFVGDPVVSVAIAVAVIAGGLGFPVLRGLWHLRQHHTRWTLHMKLTLFGTAALLAIGFVGFLVFEWTNSRTFGDLSVAEKANAAFFQGVQPRTAGFNSVDTMALRDESVLMSIALMFIGGGSASTAGGVKVTTFFLLGYVMWAEIRGDQDVNSFGRRVPTTVQRQAITVSLAGVGILAVGTLALSVTGDGTLVASAFEAVSALSTVGLSLGVTASSDSLADLVLVVLMYLGRLGPLTLATAIALRSQPILFRYPEERPLIG